MLQFSDSFKAELSPPLTARTRLWVMAKWITVHPLSACDHLLCMFRCVEHLRVCVWVRETSAIVGLLHPDNWEPSRLKITQHSPILSSFGTASSVCFESVRVPLECSGSQTVTSCHMVPHCGAHNCLWAYSFKKIGHQERKGLCCQVFESLTRWASLNAGNDSFFLSSVSSWNYLFSLWASEDEFLEGFCKHPEQN